MPAVLSAPPRRASSIHQIRPAAPDAGTDAGTTPAAAWPDRVAALMDAVADMPHEEWLMAGPVLA